MAGTPAAMTAIGTMSLLRFVAEKIATKRKLVTVSFKILVHDESLSPTDKAKLVSDSEQVFELWKKQMRRDVFAAMFTVNNLTKNQASVTIVMRKDGDLRVAELFALLEAEGLRVESLLVNREETNSRDIFNRLTNQPDI